MKINLYIITLLVFSFTSQIALGSEPSKNIGLGFEFGTSFQSFQKSNFKNGGANFFRLNMRNSNSGMYFLHNESGNISAGVGDATTTLTANVIGIGSGFTLGDSFLVNLLVGNATLTGVAGVGTGTNAITAVQSTSPVADIGVHWSKDNENVSLIAGIAYRYLTLSSPISFTDSAGKTENINDMSSLNINVSILYSF
jgi:hypothetical protein